jgi:virulence factor Mce-like protein
MFGRPVGKQRSRAFMLTIGIGGLLLAALTFYIGYQAAYSVPFRGYYNLHAQFANAENLANHYEIREGGVRIGQILNPHVSNGLAVIDMRIDDKYKPLRSDTQLRIRLRSAVGVRYLEVIPGTKGTPLPDGATIPAKNTATPVELDKVLGVFDPTTRDRTRALLNELGIGTMSRGPDVNEALAGAPKFFSQLGSVSTAITDRPGAAAAFVARGNGAADAFDAVRGELATGFQPEARALAPFNDQRKNVQATLSAAGPTLADLQRTLPGVSRLLAQVRGLAHDGLPTLRQAPATLRSTTRLLSGAAKPLGQTKRTLQLLSKAVSPTLNLLGKVRPVLPPLDRAVGDLIPTLDYAAPRSCDITQFATGWAEYIKWGDSFNNMIRFLVAAVRPEQPAGQTVNVDKVPAPGGGDLYDGFVNAAPYPPPCVNGVGVTGFPQPTESESIKGETYSATNPPGNG